MKKTWSLEPQVRTGALVGVGSLDGFADVVAGGRAAVL
jgi:hypothetical protein